MRSRIESVEPLGGGSINLVYKIQTPQQAYCLKLNSAGRFPGMFEAEEKGLAQLCQTAAIRTPMVIATGESESISFLLMDFIESEKPIINYWNVFGESLAALHKNTSMKHGLNHNNYIGSLRQSNLQHESGIDFLIGERYEPLVKLLVNKNLFTTKEIQLFEKLYKLLPELLPDEPPSLLHGDLWNGNFLTGPDGKAWLIDPAVYYGYRETDLAMARLFGGFDESFFMAYQKTFPLPPGWEQRVELFQIYPLLVHLVLFGKPYQQVLNSALKLYVG